MAKWKKIAESFRTLQDVIYMFSYFGFNEKDSGKGKKLGIIFNKKRKKIFLRPLSELPVEKFWFCIILWDFARIWKIFLCWGNAKASE